MAESIHYQISQALVAALDAIAGDGGSTYWYTPSRVVRVSVWDRLIADASHEHILGLRAGEETHTEESTGTTATGGGMLATAEFYLLMLRREEADTGDPFDKPTTPRELVVDRMVRDCVRALLGGDVTLGGLAINIADGSLIVDRDIAVEGAWAVAEARFAVQYSYMSKTP